MSEQKYLGALDYVIFCLTLVVSTGIGIYFGYKHRRKMTAAEYLIANRSISWFPIFLSLVASFFSAVGVMGITSQIYSTGVTFALQAFAFLPPIILNAEVFAPLFRRLQLTSVNEYLELRFSRGIRLLGCLYFMLQYLLFLSIVLYAPSLALETVAQVPMMATILSTGLICTLYTTLGGMRGVIWADVFQFVVMLVGVVGIAIVGVFQVGYKNVFDTAVKYKRLEVNYDPDPRSYHTVWGSVIGISFSICGAWVIGQPTVQRVISAKSLTDAKKALYCSFFGLLLIFVLLTIDALVIFAHFIGCEPHADGQIKTVDQILPYFIVNQFSDLMGLSGLFIASLFSFALSTMSSALNSMAALFLEDIVKSINPTITETWQTGISKIVACVFGLFVTGFAFVVPRIGGLIIKLVIQLFGIVGGPYFSMFLMGVFTHRANSAGAAIGSLSGFGVGCALAIGQIFYPPDRQLPPISMQMCRNATQRNETFFYPTSEQHSNVIADIVSVSYLWHGLISVLVTCVVGMLVSSCCSSCCDSPFLDKKLLFSYRGCCSFRCSCSCCKEKDDFQCEVYDQELIQNGPFAERDNGCVDSNT